MADEADQAQHQIEQGLAAVLKNIDPTIHGEMGECMDCGETGRLVNEICVPCRKLEEARNKKWRHV